MMVQSPNTWRLVGGFAIPESGHVLPNLSVADVVILNCHPIAAQIAQTFHPRIFECWYRLVDQVKRNSEPLGTHGGPSCYRPGK